MSNKPITRKEMFMAKASGQNVNTPKPITREEKFLEKIAENGGKATSWKDLGEKTVMGDTLTWEGNTEGLYSIMGTHYHVSDIVPTLEELQHGGIVSFSTNVSVPFDSTAVAPWSENIIVIPFKGVPTIIVVSEDNAILEDNENTITIEKAGIYLLYENDGDDLLYITSLTINGYNGFPTTEITPLPNKYLPEADLVIEINGPASSKVTVKNMTIVKGDVLTVKEMFRTGKCPNVVLHFIDGVGNAYLADNKKIKGEPVIYGGYLFIGYVAHSYYKKMVLGQFCLDDDGTIKGDSYIGYATLSDK